MDVTSGQTISQAIIISDSESDSGISDANYSDVANITTKREQSNVCHEKEENNYNNWNEFNKGTSEPLTDGKQSSSAESISLEINNDDSYAVTANLTDEIFIYLNKDSPESISNGIEEDETSNDISIDYGIQKDTAQSVIHSSDASNHSKNENEEDEFGNNRMYKCNVCIKEFKTKIRYENHLRIHTQASDFICLKCGKICTYAWNLRRHQKMCTPGFMKTSKTSNTKTECSICGKQFKHKADLEVHLRKHTGVKPFKCKFCDKTFTQVGNMRTHMTLKHTGDTPFTCKVCGEGFYQLSNFTAHKYSHSGDKPFKCQFCDKAFTLKGNMRQHMLKHTGVTPFICKICGKGFYQLSNFTAHKYSHSGDKPFKCQFCDMAFTLKGNMRQHMLKHTGIKQFKCQFCDKAFTQKGTMNKHLFQHTGVKPFKCQVCDKAFILKGNMRTHMLKHSGDTPFTCKVCGKGFYQLSNFRAHKYKHSGKKPFKCFICNKGFTQAGNLKTHVRIHTGDNFPCTVCDKTFAQKNTLRNHLKTHTTSERLNEVDKQYLDSGNNEDGSLTMEEHKSSTKDNKNKTQDMHINVSERSTDTTKALNKILPKKRGPKPKKKINIEDGRKSTVDIQAENAAVSETQSENLEYLSQESSFNRSDRNNTNSDQFEHDSLTVYTDVDVLVNKDKYPCEICFKEFKTKLCYKNHKKNHTQVTDFKCKACGKICSYAFSLRKHQMVCCPDSIETKAKLVGRQFIKKQMSPVKCSMCSKSFNFKSNLYVHMRTHTGEKPFKCSVCNKEFSQRHSLKSHELIHSGEKPFKCSCCYMKFSYQTSLNSHKLKHKQAKYAAVSENESENLEYLSQKSSFDRSDRDNTNSDQFEHDSITAFKDVDVLVNEDKYTCEICFKEFKAKIRYENHKRMHTRVTDFKCKKCGKVCSYAFTLRKHQKVCCPDVIESKAKTVGKGFVRIPFSPFKCSYCSKSFNVKSLLDNHIRKHTKEKPFKCSICSKRFSQALNLKNHVRIHTGDVFPCTVCGKIYTYKHSLKYHYKKSHKASVFLNEVDKQHSNITKNEDKSNETDTPDKTYMPERRPDTLQALNNTLPKKRGRKPKKKTNVEDETKSTYDYPAETATVSETDSEEYKHISPGTSFHTSNGNNTNIDLTKPDSLAGFNGTDVVLVNVPVDKYTCEICYQEFKSKLRYENHKRIHTEVSEFKCTKCGRICSYAFSLRKHQKVCCPDSVETKDKSISRQFVKKQILPVKCSICSKSFKFKSNSNLYVHMRIHTGDKPLKCSICNAGFSQQNGLNRHYRTHKGEKNEAEITMTSSKDYGENNFHCGVCKKMFNQKVRLEQHIRLVHDIIIGSTHVGSTTHACNTCNKVFTNKSKLKCHEKTCQAIGSSTQENEASHIQIISSQENKDSHIQKISTQENKYSHIQKISTQEIENSHIQKVNQNDTFEEQEQEQIRSRLIEMIQSSPKENLLELSKKIQNIDFTIGRSKENVFKCDTCHKPFLNEFDLNKHCIRMHLNGEGFKCDICCKEFRNLHFLKEHIQKICRSTTTTTTTSTTIVISDTTPSTTIVISDTTPSTTIVISDTEENSE